MNKYWFWGCFFFSIKSVKGDRKVLVTETVLQILQIITLLFSVGLYGLILLLLETLDICLWCTCSISCLAMLLLPNE